MRYASITDRLSGLGSGKWLVHIRARQMAAAGADIIELTIGEPDVPPAPELIEICHSAMKRGRTRYSNGRGEPELLKALSRKYSARTGRKVGEDQFLCFPGTQTALFAAMLGLVEEGHAVLAGDPFYATYEGVIRSTGARMVSVPLKARHGFHMRAEDVEAAITRDARVLLLNTPHNPTGAVLSAEEIAEIGEVCRKHDLWIISDEVYEELIFGSDFASPFDNADLAERTVVVSSISKSHAAPGFRSGWTAGPAEFCARLLPVAETMLFGNQPFIADMTAHALAQPSAAAKAMREAYLRRARLVADRLADIGGLRPIMPEAGMFILIDVRDTGLSGEAFAAALLEHEGVAVMPGSSFGEQATGFVRVSLTVPDERLLEACARLGRFVARLAGHEPARASG